ncbi:uncharacterized protein PGTG_00904 [Puccinia graminis f. sp. tritici CRL 75-36-700-3]|uniref:Uncharacterized protein n=1 Tax=Puccinia graminis f. sp. tritici (strain CRL 75-36-700-3 / race SCCL) TaxID=418459 RepID=E3JU48_PUCGT|nr:uncharacterized protein PGTG_00904 [Puccinia graminis f. sp. tritici CRL 75-36-700-3]EFP75573.1 hypothetical protein PGTG_00904 [Puccinia graminis f. sp. tritici CRL 75-36-700-3]
MNINPLILGLNGQQHLPPNGNHQAHHGPITHQLGLPLPPGLSRGTNEYSSSPQDGRSRKNQRLTNSNGSTRLGGTGVLDGSNVSIAGTLRISAPGTYANGNSTTLGIHHDGSAPRTRTRDNGSDSTSDISYNSHRSAASSTRLGATGVLDGSNVSIAGTPRISAPGTCANGNSYTLGIHHNGSAPRTRTRDNGSDSTSDISYNSHRSAAYTLENSSGIHPNSHSYAHRTHNHGSSSNPAIHYQSTHDNRSDSAPSIHYNGHKSAPGPCDNASSSACHVHFNSLSSAPGLTHDNSPGSTPGTCDTSQNPVPDTHLADSRLNGLALGSQQQHPNKACNFGDTHLSGQTGTTGPRHTEHVSHQASTLPDTNQPSDQASTVPDTNQLRNQASTVPNTNQPSTVPVPKPRKPRKKKAPVPVTDDGAQAVNPNGNVVKSTIPAGPTQRETITRFLNENNPPPEIPAAVQPTMAEFMNKTTAEIRKIAQDKSKKVMTGEDEAFFFEFYEKQQRKLAAAAVQRHVSVGMVEHLLGQKQAVRKASGWNNFQTKHSSLFKGKGKGVRGSGAMSELSVMWTAMTPEERAAYATENLSPTEKDPTRLRVNSESLRLAEKRVEKWMNTWQKKAVNIAASNHCEIVIFAVSSHLCDYSFQNIRATPGAAEFVREITSSDGLKNYQSRLQAFLTGARLNHISASLAKETSKKGQSKSEVTATREKLAELVDHAKDGKKASWTWQGCDDALGKLGYKVIFMPGHVSQPDWIKSYSNSLRPTEAKLINQDIDNGLIRVIHDQDALIGRTRTIKQKATQPLTPGEDHSANQPPPPPNGHHQQTNQKKKSCKTPPVPRKPRKRARVPLLTPEEQLLDESSSESSESEIAI